MKLGCARHHGAFFRRRDGALPSDAVLDLMAAGSTGSPSGGGGWSRIWSIPVSGTASSFTFSEPSRFTNLSSVFLLRWEGVISASQEGAWWGGEQVGWTTGMVGSGGRSRECVQMCAGPWLTVQSDSADSTGLSVLHGTAWP